jgi:putative acetyltransferase
VRKPGTNSNVGGAIRRTEIRRARPADRPILFDVWERSVRATHTFLTEADIALLAPKVVDYLATDGLEFVVVCDEDDRIAGFMALGADEIEALFLAPEHLRRGLGTQLIEEARTRRPGVELTVDVNEQNVGARRFYEARGFVAEGRSELDDQGLQFPIIHMRSPFN